MPVISNDQVLINKQQSSSTTITSTTHAASRPSTDSSSQDIKRPSPAEAPAAGGKRALLCGVTCRGAGGNISRLEGPVNDVKEIKKLLIKHFGYTEECIRVLTDQEENKNKSTIPTKENIEGSLKWLVKDAKSGDSLVFFFSGHGRLLRQPESCHVCLVDCTGEGMIPNSYINSTIVRPLKEGVTLYAIVDACHSGSILDLNYEYNQQRNEWSDPLEKGTTSGGLAICLSACRDDQTAPETNANYSSGKGTPETMGPMTYHLIQNFVTSNHPANVTYEYILKKMHESRVKNERILHLINSNVMATSKLGQDVWKRKQIKEPVLSSSSNFEVSSKKFFL